MANIQKRVSSKGKTSYRCLIRLKGHPSESATFDRLTDAKKWAQSTEAAIREGRYFKISESKKRTLSELISRYKDTVLPTKPKSEYEQSYQLGWWDKEIGNYLIADVTPALLSVTRDKLAKRVKKNGATISPATIVRYLAALSHVFTIALKEWQWADENPVSKIQKPKEPKGRVRFLSKEEIGSLTDECKASTTPFLYEIFLLAISTGMRRGEILGLRWNYVDLTQGRITLTETKNNETRVVPIRGKALKALAAHSKVRRLDTNLVFPSQRNPLKPIKIDNAFSSAVKACGIENYHFHDNRHTAASYLAMSGASLNEIAAILGHKTLTMVQRYAHLYEDYTSSVVEKMNDDLFT